MSCKSCGKITDRCLGETLEAPCINWQIPTTLENCVGEEGCVPASFVFRNLYERLCELETSQSGACCPTETYTIKDYCIKALPSNYCAEVTISGIEGSQNSDICIDSEELVRNFTLKPLEIEITFTINKNIPHPFMIDIGVLADDLFSDAAAITKVSLIMQSATANTQYTKTFFLENIAGELPSSGEQFVLQMVDNLGNYSKPSTFIFNNEKICPENDLVPPFTVL
jgi:hypothetical protein